MAHGVEGATASIARRTLYTIDIELGLIRLGDLSAHIAHIKKRAKAANAPEDAFVRIHTGSSGGFIEPYLVQDRPLPHTAVVSWLVEEKE